MPQLKICDFGFSKAQDIQSETSTMVRPDKALAPSFSATVHNRISRRHILPDIHSRLRLRFQVGTASYMAPELVPAQLGGTYTGKAYNGKVSDAHRAAPLAAAAAAQPLPCCGPSRP